MLILRNFYPILSKLNCNVALLPSIVYTNSANLHTSVINCAVVKKTTSAAGGIY